MLNKSNAIPIKQLKKLERQTKLYEDTDETFKKQVTLDDFLKGNWNLKSFKQVTTK